VHLIVGRSVFMWDEGVLLDADGVEVCSVDLVLDSDDPGWRVTWADGSSAHYRSLPELRRGIVRTLHGLHADEGADRESPR
jgi:hypothetical protein